MKTVNGDYEVLNSSLVQEPRYVIELAYDWANADLVYFTSHNDSIISPFTSGFEPSDITDWTAPVGAEIRTNGAAYSGFTSGSVTCTSDKIQGADAQSDTGGVYAEIPSAVANLYGGHTVRVSAMVRSADGSATQCLMAYSTSEVGNSLWQLFSGLTTEWQRVSFDYVVNFPVTGNPDYVGIWGHTAGSVLFDQLRVEVIDEANAPTGGELLRNVIADNGLTSTTQKLNPLAGNASIGAITVKLLDDGNRITEQINRKLTGGDGLKGKRLRIYRGFAGMAWADYELFQTQIVDTVLYSDGVYTVKCADVQRSQRKKIFELNSTNLTHTVGLTDTLIPVGSTAGFQLLQHGPSYSDAPNSTVGYIKLDNEVVRYSGVTVDGTLGPCFVVDTLNARGRGALGTVPAEHQVDSTASEDRNTEVEEFVYLELPLVKLAYAILTGTLYGDLASLPDNWHLAISTNYVKTAEFVQIGTDWWDTSNDSNGRIGRFTGLKEEDGKKFLEKEIYQLLGAYSPVLADGSLGLRRMTRVLFDASACCTLGPNDIISHTDLTHEMRAVANQLRIDWNYDHVKDETTRSNLLVDAQSIAMHGASAVTELKFIGLHGSRHTGQTLNEHFATLRDRYAGPPQRLKVTTFMRNHRIEIGDIVRIDHPSIQDYVTGQSIDRSFEVQNLNINWSSGKVTLDLFGSSQPADAAVLSTVNALQDSWYTTLGTNLETLPGVTNISGVIHIAADLDLTGTIGNLDMRVAGATVYANGPLVIDSNVTLTCNLNTQIRVKGHVQVDGKIDAKGNGHTGALSTAVPTGYSVFDTRWYRFNTPADPGVPTYGASASQGGVVTGDSNAVYRGYVHSGDRMAVEFFALDNPDGTSLDGLPQSLIGVAGATGGHAAINGGSGADTFIQGGDGGDSGGGLLFVCRGFDVGAAGVIDVSGNNGGQGATSGSSAAGAGAGGCPGGVVVMLDGNTPYPTGLSRITALRGVSPYQGVPITTDQSTDNPGRLVCSAYEESALVYLDQSDSMVRVQYIPPPETATEDLSSVASAPTAINVVEFTNTPQTPAENLATLEISVTPPSDSVYSHSDIYYKLDTQTAWIYVGPADAETVATVAMDGSTYDIKAVPVSIFGTESDEYITDTYTVVNEAGGVNLATGNYIAYNKTAYTDDLSVGFWLGIDGLTAKFNLGDITNNLKWDGANLVITGIINALGGGDIAGWTINANTLVSPNGRIILDSANNRIRVENLAGTNYIHIDGDGITAFDTILGTTMSLPTDGSAPTFSSGVINNTVYEITTAGVLRTSANPPVSGGVLINDQGIQVYNTSGQRTAFLDAVNSAHEFSGAVTITGGDLPTSAENLIFDPDFVKKVVDGIDYWSDHAQAVYGLASGENGTPGVVITANSTTIDLLSSVYYPVKVGDVLRFKAVVYETTGLNGSYSMGLVTYDKDKVNLASYPLTVVTAGTNQGVWKTVHGNVTVAAAAAAYVTIRLTLRADATTSSLSISNVYASKIEEGADVTSSAITAGVTISAGEIRRGTNEILLDYTNRRVTIGNETYGNDGIQLEYNAGNPRVYAGDGANNYMEFDGAGLTVSGVLKSTGTAGQQRIEINPGNDNEMHFYGDRGDGTVEELATLGINAVGYDGVIGLFGTSTSSRTAVRCLSNSSFTAAHFQNYGNGASAHGLTADASGLEAAGVYGSNSTADSFGVYGYALNGYGIRGGGDYGGQFEGVTAPVVLVPDASSAAPVHAADKGSLHVTSLGVLYINTNGSTTWQKVGAQ